MRQHDYEQVQKKGFQGQTLLNPLTNMKTKILLALLIAVTTSLNAQTWSGTTPGNIYYNSGNVSIGSTTPNDKLDLANGGIRLQRISSPLTGGTIFGQIFQLQDLVGTSDGLVYQADSHQFRNYDGVPEFTVNNGFIGFGTATPSDKLDVANGGIRLQRISSSLTGGSTYGQIFQLQNLSGTSDGIVYQSDLHQFRNFDGTPEVTINGGNVLVGKVSQINSSYKLDVNGAIRSNEVVVNTTGADFVFDERYKLRSLNDVEKYVKENGHLPDIQSAKEMEENGLELGKMDMKLLQKIEELTLYIIDFKKEMDKMKAENQKLKERIVELEKN